MTDLPAFPSGSPHELLSSSRELSRRVRAAQRGAWFPLLVLGAITLLAIPVDRIGRSTTCQSIDTTRVAVEACTVYPRWSFVYWPIALVVAYVAISVFYARRAAQQGIGTRVRPYVIVGITLAVLLTLASLWAAHHPLTQNDILGLHLQPGSSLTFLHRLVSPACAIGLALLVLARIERDWALLVFTLGYLIVVLANVGAGWAVTFHSPWYFLPHLLVTGGILLAGSAGFAQTQARQRRNRRLPA